MSPRQRSAAKEILAALDADPALIEHYDPNEIEAIPLASIQARLVELGLTPAIPVKLQRLVWESMPSPAADVLRVLADDADCLEPKSLETRALAQVTACLQRRGTNYRPGVAEIIDFVGERASASVGLDQTKVSSIKSAKLRSRKSLFLAGTGLAATAMAAVATTVGFFVTEGERQGKVIADQRYEIQELDDQVQGLKARLKEIGVDDSVSLTMRVPLSNPLEDRTRPAAAAPRVAPAAQDRGVGVIAQKVVLYEANEANPNGSQFVGSAVWHTERLAAGPGRQPDVVVRAEIEIPERKVQIRLSLRRNDDKQLPASHKVEIVFTLPPDFVHGGVSNIPGILMKQGETTRGVPLNGVAVKVATNFFLIGLSSVDADMQRNIQLLKERSWFDIPVVFSDGRRAIIAIEKGIPGESAFTEAFATWGQ